MTQWTGRGVSGAKLLLGGGILSLCSEPASKAVQGQPLLAVLVSLLFGVMGPILVVLERLPDHDWYRVLGRMLRLPFGGQPCLRKAVDLSRQGDTRLRRAGPNVRCYLHCIGVVVATPRDCAEIRPALKGKADGRSASRTEFDVDLPSAYIGCVLVLANLTIVELDCLNGEHGVGIERGARHPLTECAVTNKGSMRRLFDVEPNRSAEAATVENKRHLEAPGSIL